MIQFGIYHIKSFGSNYDECSDSSTYKLRSEECCYAYHLISYCIYEERTKKTCKKQKNSCVRHLKQSNYMIPISSVDKLISKNLHKMEKTPISIVQEKMIKNENDYHEKSIINSRRKAKINWNECFPERRRSRRLSNLPPIDDIKIEIKYEDISESFDNISYNILSTTEQIKGENILNNENNDYIDKDIKLEPVDGVDEFQDVDICENVLNDKSDLTLCKQNMFLISDTEKNCTQINSSYTNNIQNTNIPETLFNLETTYLKSTDTYDYSNTNDNINLNRDENRELPTVVKCWSTSAPDQCTFYETTKIQDFPPVPETYSEITKIEQIPSLSKTYSKTTETENNLSLSKKCSKPTETEKNSFLPETYFTIIENEKSPPLPRKNVEVIKAKDISSIPKTCSGILEIDKMPSLFKNHSGITEIKKNIFVPVTTKTHSKIIDTENISSLPNTTETEDISFLPKKNSKNTEAKEIESQHETYSNIIDTEQMSFLSETHSEIIETEEVTTAAYSGIVEMNKSSPLLEKNSISNKTKEMPPSTETYFKIYQTENTPSQFETFLEITDTNEMAYYPETFEIQEIPSLHTTFHSNVINGHTLHPVMAVQSRQILPKIDTQKIENKQSEYFKMTLPEKLLYRKKLAFMTTLDLVTKEKFEELMHKKNNVKPVKPVISKKKSSYSKVLSTTNEDYTERVYYRTSSDKIRRSYLLEYSDNNDNQKHVAVPVLVPERTSGSSFHPERTCKLKCGNCHGKFGLLDTPYHLAQIKNIEKQRACLENVTHLIGPDSCLCATCFRAIEKQSCKKYLPKDSCIIKTCKNTTLHIFESPYIDKIKHIFNKKGVNFRNWPNKIESMPICDLHYNEVTKIIDCQLCGNKTSEKYEIKEVEEETFKISLNKDQIPVTLDHDLLICKACRVYLLWRVRKISLHIKKDFIKLRNTVLQRICHYRKMILPSCVLNFYNETIEKEREKEIEEKNHSTVALSKPVDNHFVMVSSLRTIDNNDVYGDNFVQSLPIATDEVTPITNTSLHKSTNIVANDQQQNHQSDVAMVRKNDDNNCEIVPPHVLKQFSQPSEILKPIVSKQTVFVPILKKVDPKKFKAPAEKLVAICKPNIVSLTKTQSPQTDVNTLKALPPPPAAIPFVKPKEKLLIDDEDSPNPVSLDGKVYRKFSTMKRTYPNSLRLLRHLLVLEKCRRLGDIQFPNENCRYGFPWGFSRKRVKSKLSTQDNCCGPNNNTEEAIMRPLFDNIVTIEQTEDNGCNNEKAQVSEVNDLHGIVNIDKNLKNHNFYDGQDLESPQLTSGMTKQILEPICDENLKCKVLPQMKMNTISIDDSSLCGNQTSATVTTSVSTTTIPFIYPIRNINTIPSKNINRKLIVLNTKKNGMKGSFTMPSKCTKMSTMKQFLSQNTVRNDSIVASNHQIVPPVDIPIKSLTFDRLKAIVHPSDIDKTDTIHK